MDPVTSELVSGSIKEETDQVMKNLNAVLEAAGMTFDNVVKTSIFVKDMNQFSEINEAYGAHFNSDSAPARETVEVSNLPKFVNVEISMIAVQ